MPTFEGRLTQNGTPVTDWLTFDYEESRGGACCAWILRPDQPCGLVTAWYDGIDCYYQHSVEDIVIMTDTRTSANRVVAGWEVYLRRAPWEDRWEVSLCDRMVNVDTAVMEGFLITATLSSHYFHGKTFATPDEAAAYVRRLVAA